jgi:hypothetical protein
MNRKYHKKSVVERFIEKYNLWVMIGVLILCWIAICLFGLK